jgi:hypothetical protein
MGLGITGEGLRAFLYLQNNTRGAGVNKKIFAYTDFHDLEKVVAISKWMCDSKSRRTTYDD